MAKKMSFADKAKKKAEVITCPVCAGPILYVKHTKAMKGDSGSWKFRTVNIGVCKCNEAEVYA